MKKLKVARCFNNPFESLLPSSFSKQFPQDSSERDAAVFEYIQNARNSGVAKERFAKLIVLGPKDAGKSALIASLATPSHMAERWADGRKETPYAREFAW